MTTPIKDIAASELMERRWLLMETHGGQPLSPEKLRASVEVAQINHELICRMQDIGEPGLRFGLRQPDGSLLINYGLSDLEQITPIDPDVLDESHDAVLEIRLAEEEANKADASDDPPVIASGRMPDYLRNWQVGDLAWLKSVDPRSDEKYPVVVAAVTGMGRSIGLRFGDTIEADAPGHPLFVTRNRLTPRSSPEALAQDSLVAATAPCPISTWESEGGAVPETDALVESASLYRALDEIEANVVQRVAAELNAPAPNGHVHTRECFDDAGPGAGGVSMVCGFD